ncbi:heterokaryon incompatibility protein-domain-containing protein [Parachaetomium inaequale]|uniref:Heterokaryon incompatibility protein-domain-containing protein n=1 Tax=Parachaetomium inaequale TaxID=2588326 RepID=A0AAN6P879_9PEZI|nr:heterokaryon incompatibility protein-domain-containing protein [Parachaetomium inaequale]
MPIFTILLFGVVGTEVYQRVISPNLFAQKRKRQAYQDLQLREETKDIRLLIIQPGSLWARIRCDLAVASLEPPYVPDYRALSYTWNEPIQPSAPLTTVRGVYQYVRALYWKHCRLSHQTILINGRPFPVTNNLATALRYVRHSKKPVRLWVDSICINQNDNAEKSRQVRMMPDIYSNASATYIWLGPRADGSDEAMEFIRSAHGIETDDANLDIDKLVPTRALTALFNRTWWQRVWVIQEAALSERSVVLCGRKAVSFSNFQSLVIKERAMRRSARVAARKGALDSPNMRVWSFIPPALPFYAVLYMMGVFRSKALGNLSTEEAAAGLAELVQVTARFQSTLPRDKVYGLLGLVPGAGREIEPSYGPDKTDSDVLRELTVFLTRWTNSIDHIFPWRKPETERVCGAPSWAIDATSASEALPFDHGSGYDADRGFRTWLRLTPTDIIKGYSPEPPASSGSTTGSAEWFWESGLRFVKQRVSALRSGEYGVNPEFPSSDMNILRLHGLVVDDVVAASPAPKTYPIDIYRVSNPATNSVWATIWGATLQYHRVKQLVLRWQSFLQASMDSPEMAATDPYLDLHGEGGREVAFWRAIMANRIREPDGSFGAPDDKFMKEVPPMFSGDASPISWGYWEPFWSRKGKVRITAYRLFTAECFRAATGRSLILTKRGFIGLATIDVKMGDVVCVVRGYKSLVVLRPVAGKENVYRLVGDCYVHGMMDGRFAQGASRQEVKKFDIE